MSIALLTLGSLWELGDYRKPSSNFTGLEVEASLYKSQFYALSAAHVE